MATAKKTSSSSSAAKSAQSRTQRDAAPQVRGARGVQEDAQRIADSGLTSAELEKLIREEFDSSNLPKPPALAGYHLCWLTTTSGFDTVSKRQRIGYTPVRTEELPGFDPSNGQSLANYEGFVTCNEMVLFKIPERIYQMFMRIYHHNKPLEDETSIVERAKAMEQAADSSGRPLLQSSGEDVSDLERVVKHNRKEAPHFS